MTDQTLPDYGDPVTAPFWAGAQLRKFLIQRCNHCGARQFYPRCFCLSCQSLDLGWIESAGRGVVYSLVHVRIQVLPDLPPPYQLALIDLDEDIRLLSNIVGPPAKIGDRVDLEWRDRKDMPPLPVFSVRG